MVDDGDVIWADLKGEAVLLNIESGIYFGLNPVGSMVWKLLCEGSDEDEICARLLDEFDVAPDQLRADVAGFLDGLSAEELVRFAES
jgi:hypothetical protein